jgi:peptidoglycan/xylan/chitin deacetylase (PgdA/CDA1 family)
VRAAAQAAFTWPEGKRGAVSLTYDDGLDSQLAIAAPQLEAHGFRGTFFVTEENMRARLADWVALSQRGHEIGDHTVSHPCELRPYDARRFERRELAPMEAFIDAHFNQPRPRLFAYPCGATELGARGDLNARRRAYIRLMRRDFLAARIVDGGPNDPRLVTRFRYLLQANAPTYDADEVKPALDYVRRAIDRGYWAILIFHDVVDERRDTGQTSRQTHAAILDWIATQPVWCAPMGKAFSYIQTGVVKA